VVAAALALAPRPLPAETHLVDLDFKGQFQSLFGLHAFAPSDVSALRQTVELEQDIHIGRDWTIVAGARAYGDAAYAVNPRYRGQPVEADESSDIMTRDLYVQYKRPHLLVRLGSQQVVWGEAFGFYYADVVNPKDLRQFGIGDLTAQRIPVPMANVIFFLDKGSLQLVAIPKPFFNQNPSIGNDFALPFGAFVPGMNVSVTEPRSYPIALTNTEVGARASAMLGHLDMALFFFSYFNRAPEYQLTVLPPTNGGTTPNALFTAEHSRILTLGLTGTYDWGPVVTRWETLYTDHAPVDFFNPTTANPLNYGTFPSGLLTGVIGFDYTQIPSWRFGFQASHKVYTATTDGALTPQNQSLLTANINGPLFRDQTLDLLLSYVPQDGSSLLQASYLIPASSRFEVALGTNCLLGGANSEFGRFHGGSTIYVQLRGYFNST
jgi:hypothetical protein